MSELSLEKIMGDTPCEYCGKPLYTHAMGEGLESEDTFETLKHTRASLAGNLKFIVSPQPRALIEESLRLIDAQIEMATPPGRTGEPHLLWSSVESSDDETEA